MSKRIIFKNPDNSVSVITPSPEALNLYGIEAIARKDVPAGLPYVIVDTREIPSDRTFRAAWELPEDTVFHGEGSTSNTFGG